MALRITVAGLAAIGIEPEPAHVPLADVPSRPKQQRKRVARESVNGSSPAAVPHPDIPVGAAPVEQPAHQPATERARLIAPLSRKQGATPADLMAIPARAG